MAIESESHKKRILFVYRDYPTSETSTFSIVMDLSEKYEIQTHPGLNETVVETIRQAASGRKFDAIITHVPFKHKTSGNTMAERSALYSTKSVLLRNLWGKLSNTCGN